MIDVSGVMLAGAVTPSARIIQGLARETYGGGACTVIGTNDRLTAPGAALANGASAHALDFDDNSYAGVVHGSAVVFPAVLAVAQRIEASGAELLQGFVAGLEVEFALGLALTEAFYDRGWWTTSALGAMGAAAGVARVTDLDAEATARAIAMAAVGAGGIRASRGTHAKHYYCGRAAEAGVMAASLAARGSTAPLDVFEDRNGFLRVLNDAIVDEAPIDRIGQRFGLLDPGVDIKRYPTCYASHAAADATLDIMAGQHLTAADIRSIVCSVPPLVASNLTYPRPTTSVEAQFSLEFTVAAVMVFREITLDHLRAEVLAAADIQAAIGKVEMRIIDQPPIAAPGDGVCPEWAHVSLTTNTGETLDSFFGAPIGSALRPMPDTALESKFMACAKQADPPCDAQALLERLRDMDHETDCRSLF